MSNKIKTKTEKEIEKNVLKLKNLKMFSPKNIKFIDEIIELYQSRQIEKFATAETIALKIVGRGQAKASGLRELEKYRGHSSTLTKFTAKKINDALGPMIKFYIKGNVITESTYKDKKKVGNIRTIYKDDYNQARTITARTEEDAIAIFRQMMNEDFTKNRESTDDSNNFKSTIVKSITASASKFELDGKGFKISKSLMRSCDAVEYDFIPADKTLDLGNGFCVVDQFVGTYSKDIKSLTREYFIELCYLVRGEIPPSKTDVLKSNLDVGISEDEDDINPLIWTIEQGVTPDMLNKICIMLQISHYAFDVEKKCFLKSISPNRNYKALIYYCVNNHMYHVTNSESALGLSHSAREIETKIKSICIDDTKEQEKNIFKDKKIFENVPIKDLVNYKDCIIMYNQKNTDNQEIHYKHNLNDELDEIIGLYEYVPKIKNQKYAVIRIDFNQNDQKVILVVDPNDQHIMTYKDIQKICVDTKLEFKNQSFGAIVSELKDKFFNAKSIRHTFTKEERIAMFKDEPTCEICKKSLKVTNFEIDHIIPLGNGGTNDADNLQVLCKPCHFEKSKTEKEHGYVKISETESSFNTVTKEIFNSPLNAKYAFVEAITEKTPQEVICKGTVNGPLTKTEVRTAYEGKDGHDIEGHINYGQYDLIKYDLEVKNKNKVVGKETVDKQIYSIDLNRCRKNSLMYSQYDYPLFTVMDEPTEYKGLKATGLFFIESNNYLPLRANGWYSLPMVEYCLSTKIITEEDIKYVVYSGLTIEHDYYNEFVTHLYDILGNNAKMAVNAMIGMFKPKPRESWVSKMIITDANCAFNHLLRLDGCFIDSRDINGKQYYQVYEKYMTNKEESDAPIYNQILDLEAIELHKLMKVVEGHNGIVLDVTTDAVTCVFNEAFPFTISEDGVNIEGYYYDTPDICGDLLYEPIVHKYKLEDKSSRLKVPKLPKYKRMTKYLHVKNEMNIIYDVEVTYEQVKQEIINAIGVIEKAEVVKQIFGESKDFNDLVKQILDSNKSIHIDGRAGTGKSYLIKLIQAEMEKREISFKSLAPTNKACRIINGQTIHRFVASNQLVKDKSVTHLFIDEVSMMAEAFYKYFIVLKRMRPDLKFIIAGDFEQLLPVKDRVQNCNYKDSSALFELCDGNRLQLTKCRRSDSTLFNMLLPENIGKIKKENFKHTIHNLNISFTNKKRMSINRMMMDNYVRQKKTKPVEFKKLSFDDNSQDVRLLAGMPVIARKNNKKLNIFNNETFTISEIRKTTETIIVVEDGRSQEVPFKDFQHMFYIAFCITCHKSQGCTFDEDYTIHEFDMMDNRLKYVALSRSVNINLINIV